MRNTNGGGHCHAVHQAGAECPDPDPGLQASPALSHHLHCSVLETGDNIHIPPDKQTMLNRSHFLITVEALWRQLSWDVKSLFWFTVSFHISLDAFARALKVSAIKQASQIFRPTVSPQNTPCLVKVLQVQQRVSFWDTLLITHVYLCCHVGYLHKTVFLYVVKYCSTRDHVNSYQDNDTNLNILFPIRPFM